jgi:hypothetical protein
MNFVTPALFMALAVATCSCAFIAEQAHAQTQEAAASPVSLRSDVKIERIERDASGNDKVTLYTPKDVAVVPGDNVVFSLFVKNGGAEPAVGFKATNPMPAAVRFASVAEDWAEVSVDGGILWGKLADLKVKDKDAAGAEVVRPATPDDVTHVRWIFPDAIAPGTERTVSYRGIVK